MHVRIEVFHKKGERKRVSLDSDAIIGRSRECDLRIASGEVSRRHCKLTVVPSGVLVRDLNSSNGTYVNGEAIPPNRDVALTPGSRITIGPTEFSVFFDASDLHDEALGSTVEMPSVPVSPPESPEGRDSGPSGDGADAVETVLVDDDVAQNDGSPPSESQEKFPDGVDAAEAAATGGGSDVQAAEIEHPTGEEHGTPRAEGFLQRLMTGAVRILPLGRRRAAEERAAESETRDAALADGSPDAAASELPPAPPAEQEEQSASGQAAGQAERESDEDLVAEPEEFLIEEPGNDEGAQRDGSEVDSDLNQFLGQFDH